MIHLCLYPLPVGLTEGGAWLIHKNMTQSMSETDEVTIKVTVHVRKRLKVHRSQLFSEVCMK